MKRLESAVEAGVALSTLIDRVDLLDADIRVSLRLPIAAGAEDHPGTNDSALTMTRVFPVQIRRSGFEMRLVIQGDRASAPLADLTLIKAIAKGRLWAVDLLAGRVESVAAIARCEGVLPNYVRRMTRLAFLSPRIVEAIVAGRLPGSPLRHSLNGSKRSGLIGPDARDFSPFFSAVAPNPKRSRQICRQRLSPALANHPPETDLLCDHILRKSGHCGGLFGN
jgi:hypothetical protein